MKDYFLDGIHGLRALAAIVVVIFHAGGILGSEKYQGLTWLPQITGSLDTGVDLFFVISGFVISFPFFLGRIQPLNSYLANRLIRIYPMAMITAFIYLIFNWIFFDREPEIDSVLSSFLLIPSSTDPIPIVLWTLKQELLFYFIFSLAFIRPYIGIFVVLSWSIASPLVPSSGSALLSWLFHPNNIQFSFGIAAAYLFVYHKISPTKSLLVAFSGLIAFFICGVVYQGNTTNYTLETTLLGLFGSLVAYGIACSGLQLPRAIIFLGTASYSIYLIHFFFLSAFNKVMIRIAPDLSGTISIIFLVVSAVIAGCVYYIIFERPIETLRKNRRTRTKLA